MEARRRPTTRARAPKGRSSFKTNAAPSRARARACARRARARAQGAKAARALAGDGRWPRCSRGARVPRARTRLPPSLSRARPRARRRVAARVRRGAGARSSSSRSPARRRARASCRLVFLTANQARAVTALRANNPPARVVLSSATPPHPSAKACLPRSDATALRPLSRGVRARTTQKTHGEIHPASAQPQDHEASRVRLLARGLGQPQRSRRAIRGVRARGRARVARAPRAARSIAYPTRLEERRAQRLFRSGPPQVANCVRPDIDRPRGQPVVHRAGRSSTAPTRAAAELAHARARRASSPLSRARAGRGAARVGARGGGRGAAATRTCGLAAKGRRRPSLRAARAGARQGRLRRRARRGRRRRAEPRGVRARASALLAALAWLAHGETRDRARVGRDSGRARTSSRPRGARCHTPSRALSLHDRPCLAPARRALVGRLGTGRAALVHPAAKMPSTRSRTALPALRPPAVVGARRAREGSSLSLCCRSRATGARARSRSSLGEYAPPKSAATCRARRRDAASARARSGRGRSAGAASRRGVS